MSKLAITYTIPPSCQHVVQDRAEVFKFPATGSIIVITTPPNTADQLVILNALGVLIKYQDGIATIQSDQHLSDTGKTAKLANYSVQEGTRLCDEIAAFQSQINVEAANCQLAHDRLFAAPKLAPDDAVSAMGDQRITEHLTSLRGTALSKALEQIQSGDKPRWLAAMMRDSELVPLSPALESVIPEAWRATVAKLYPVQVAEDRARQEASAWQLTSMAAIAQHVPAAAGSRILKAA
jgi:hypothetical protein